LVKLTGIAPVFLEVFAKLQLHIHEHENCSAR